MSTLEDWTAAVCDALELPPGAVDVGLVLDLARDVAHGVARPAAPLTAYLVGLACGAGGGVGDPALAGRLTGAVAALARDWPAAQDRPDVDRQPPNRPAPDTPSLPPG